MPALGRNRSKRDVRRRAPRALLFGLVLTTGAGAALCACNLLTGVASLERGTEDECIDGTEPACKGDKDATTGDAKGDSHVDPTCGKDCLGGACAGGACQPVVLAMNQDRPVGIAVDDKRIYWANRGSVDAGNGTVQTSALDGTDKRELVNKQPSAGFVAVDSTWVYLTDQGTEQANFLDGRIVRIRKDGTAFDRIYDNQPAPFGIAIDSANVYWTNALNGEVFRARLDGTGTPALIAPAAPYTFGIAADETAVFWTRFDPTDNLGEVYTARPDGGARGALASNQATPRGIAIDATTVYWVNEDDDTVMSLPRTGLGTPKVLADRQDKPYTIVLDDKNVYWVNQGATDGTCSVMRIGKDGTCGAKGAGDAGGECPQVLASGQSRPYGIAVDKVAVYWVNFASGNVLRVAK